MMSAFSILNVTILSIIKVDILLLLHSVCAHEITYYKQALLSLQGNLSWPLKLMLPVDEKNDA